MVSPKNNPAPSWAQQACQHATNAYLQYIPFQPDLTQYISILITPFLRLLE